jgi:hypothetical protein
VGFPSIRKPLEHMHQQTANAALIRMGFGGELVAHGMRSIARTAGQVIFPVKYWNLRWRTRKK